MNLRQKHVPIRMCAVCRDKSGKRTMSRLVHTETGLVIDLTGKANGRGAYLCDNSQCWQRAAQSDMLNHALRTVLTLSDRDSLRQHAT